MSGPSKYEAKRGETHGRFAEILIQCDLAQYITCQTCKEKIGNYFQTFQMYLNVCHRLNLQRGKKLFLLTMAASTNEGESNGTNLVFSWKLFFERPGLGILMFLKPENNLVDKCVDTFLAVQDSSIGDPVSQSLSESPFDFSVFRWHNSNTIQYNSTTIALQ